MNRRQRILQRNRTERLSELLDWQSLGKVCRNCVVYINIHKSNKWRLHMDTYLVDSCIILLHYSTTGRQGGWQLRS